MVIWCKGQYMIINSVDVFCSLENKATLMDLLYCTFRKIQSEKPSLKWKES